MLCDLQLRFRFYIDLRATHMGDRYLRSFLPRASEMQIYQSLADLDAAKFQLIHAFRQHRTYDLQAPVKSIGRKPE